MQLTDEKRLKKSREYLEKLKEQRGGSVLSIHRKMANDPELIRAFSDEFEICKKGVVEIPEKYKELMFMMMGCIAKNEVTIKTHGELALKKGATVNEIGAVLRMVFFYFGASALIPGVQIFDEVSV